MGCQPQVDPIVARLPRKRQTMFFSATLDGQVGELARAYTTNPSRFEAELTIDQQQGEIDHQFVPVTAENKVETLAGLLAQERGLVLVFVRTKRGADRLVQKLARHDVTAVAMHGDMNQSQRERALKRFEQGTVKTLVATDVAARGLDLDDITHVINFDPPEEHTAYVHRVGRTGRAGKNGIGVTLVLPEQQAEVSHVARMLGHTETFKSQGMIVAPPRLVYQSKRRNSKWGPSRPRRKI
jgi:superfamily II DNA/RNA helicase